MPITLRRPAFTLIELLIVVAIIAILAAIAVPNFLEAQVRAKVSRMLSDFRAMKVGLESYRVDTNKLPETDTGTTQLPKGVGMFRLTSPVAYLTSMPVSPFNEEKMGHAVGFPQFAITGNFPLYVRAQASSTTDSDGFSDLYLGDRGTYLYDLNLTGGQSPPPLLIGRCQAGDYMIKSVGPDNLDNRDQQQYLYAARVYDPTNGTISDGDVVTFGDTSINAANR